MPNGSRKKFKVDITDSNICIDSTGSLAIPILSHEHNNDVVMNDNSDIESVDNSDIESVDNAPLSDDTELDDNEAYLLVLIIMIITFWIALV